MLNLRHFRRLRHLHRRLVRVLVRARRGDERAEQRVRGHGARFVLGVELAADEPGVAFELDDLDELAVGGDAGDAEAALFELRACTPGSLRSGGGGALRSISAP